MPPRRGRIIACLSLDLAYASVVATVGYCNAAGPEQWRWIALNLYLPQWPWLLPGIVLVVLGAVVARRWAWVPMLPMLWVAGPQMGFRWRLVTPAPPPGAARIRVMTYNVDQRLGRDGAGLEILKANPDVILLQEANARPWALATDAAFYRYSVHGPYGGLLIACRLPQRRFDTLRVPAAEGVAVVLRCRALVAGREVSFYATHLPTPRRGIEPLIARGASATTDWQQSINRRLWHVQMVASLIDPDSGPRVVAGDLNAPQASQITRRLMRDGLADAFDAAGRGYGYTYGHELGAGGSFVRIDHILASRDWVVANCRAGGSAGSDHRPVVADLYLMPSR